MRLGTVEVIPYTSDWKRVFEEESKLLQTALAPLSVTCHHIGSTSVPDLASKPIIDILIEIPFIDQLKPLIPSLEKLGYKDKGECGIPRRHFLNRKQDIQNRSDVNLHFFETDSIQVRRYLRFCDYLRQNAKDRKLYEKVKLELAERFTNDRLAYLEGKSRVVQEIDSRAAEWKKESGVSPSCYNSVQETPTEESLVASLHHNLHMHMTYFAWYSPAMAHVSLKGDATVIQSTVKDDTYNYVLDAEFSDDQASSRVKEITSSFFKKEIPFSWWVGPKPASSRLTKLFDYFGLEEGEENIGMILDMEKGSQQEFRSSNDIRRISNPMQLLEFCSIHEAIGIDGAMEAYKEIYQKLPSNVYSEGANLELYVMCKDDRPVCSGVLLFHAGVAGIYFIATPPDERRKGYATELMSHLLHRVKQEEYPYATLTASVEGKPVYEKIGFRPLCSYQEYQS